jgi:glycosyltransferase involved in cell wall biosynthesis
VLNQKILKLEFLNTKMNKSNSKIFEYHKDSYRGTEYLAKYFHTNILKYMSNINKYRCIIMPGIFNHSSLLEDDRELIIWSHNTLSQFDTDVLELFNNQIVLNKIKYFIVPSNYAKNEIIKESKIDKEKIIVIYNGFHPVKNDINRFKKVDKVKIIHTSHSGRGFEILAKSLKYIKNDFRLNVYNDIFPDINLVSNEYKKIYKDKRIFLYGPTPKKTLIDDLSKSHIFANPSIFRETFCLSQVEAISANCLPVYNNYGALDEVSFNSGITCNFSNLKTIEECAIDYAQKIDSAIDLIRDNNFDPKDNAEKVNDAFSFKNFVNSWINLNNKL